MGTQAVTGQKRALPIIGHHAFAPIDVDAEIRQFEEEEKKRLGLDGKTEQWIEDMAGLTFTKREKDTITLLIGGLTMAQDMFVEGGLRGVGYNVQTLDVPTTEALQYGKEFGNRGQCNPTYFTVGNLVKFLCTLRDKHGMSSEEIVKRYVFFTAGACGPCRFGMYVTEFRKALRDAGFEGFRVILFQQSGGLKQATGEESGLDMNPRFFWQIVKGLIAGDVVNALAYRIRPYEVNPGDTDRALEAAKRIIYDAQKNQTNILAALYKVRSLFASVAVDRLKPKPKVSIIGEFWAMTTEGDGNYQLQRFLESEGAEADVQLVTAWLLYGIWEARRDTLERHELRAADTSYYGLGALAEDPFGVTKKLLGVRGAQIAVHGLFQTFAHLAGLYGYHLPDMDLIAQISHEHYSNDLRGGEGHMEVGKLIMNVVHQKAHMTLSVKPFGCMPSAGVSDGVQTAIVERYPGTIFCPVETSGDGRVNFYSRVQMYLFKAKQAAVAEMDRALAENGVTLDQVRAFLAAHPSFGNALHKAPHRYAGSGADLVAEVAPYVTKSRSERWGAALDGWRRSARAAVHEGPRRFVSLVKRAAERAPDTLERVRTDIEFVREMRRERSVKRPPEGERRERCDVATAAE